MPRADADGPGSLFLRFLRFGALAWGGPAAQIEMISRECVDEERWVSPETFKRTLAVYQVLPGPEAHELCVYFGRIRGGRLGALAAGLGFMLPGFLLMLGLSALYVEVGLDERFEALFYGLKAAVGALVAMAIVRLGRKFLNDPASVLLAAAVFALTVAGLGGFLLLLATAGVVYTLWSASRARALVSVAPMAAAALAGPVFLAGLQAGLLTFGGAYTAVPLLNQSVVETHGWLTQEEFLDGLALSGILPAPLVIFATFVGYAAGGLGGSLAMTAGVFLPAFALPIFFHRQLVAVADDPRIRPFLLGVAAGVVGLIAAVTVDIVRAGVVDVPTALLAVAAFAALYRFHGRLTVLWVVLGCGALGVLLQAA